MPNPALVTASSVGVSRAVNIDWRTEQAVSFAVTTGSTTLTGDFTVQFTLDDLQLTTSSAVFWFSVSSAIGSFAALHFTASAAYDTGVYGSFLNPIGGLRLSATALSSTNLVLRVLQASDA